MKPETLLKIAQNLKEINIDEIVESVINENKDKVIELNRSQLISGIDSTAQKLGKYSERYKIKRQKKGLQIEKVDLKFTGDFQKEMNLKSKAFPFSIDSDNYKAEILKKNYGEDIFGLTEKNKDELKAIINDEVVKLFSENVKKALNNI